MTNDATEGAAALLAEELLTPEGLARGRMPEGLVLHLAGGLRSSLESGRKLGVRTLAVLMINGVIIGAINGELSVMLFSIFAVGGGTLALGFHAVVAGDARRRLSLMRALEEDGRVARGRVTAYGGLLRSAGQARVEIVWEAEGRERKLVVSVAASTDGKTPPDPRFAVGAALPVWYLPSKPEVALVVGPGPALLRPR